MTSEIDRSIPIPRQHRAGERTSAKKHNEAVDALGRMLTGAEGPKQITPQRRNAGGGHEQLILVSVEPDHLVCRTFHDEVEGTEDRNVAKPWLLRQTPFEEGGDLADRADKTYTYLAEDGTSRIVADADGYKQFEQIDPEWLPDDPLIATGPIEGGTGVTVGGEDLLQLDANTDGRAWTTFARGGFVCAGMEAAATATDATSNFLLDTWITRQPVPEPTRSRTAGFSLGNLGYLVGGQAYGGSEPADTDLLYYRRETWTSGPSIVSPGHHRHAGAAAGGKGYVWGGTYPGTSVRQSFLDEFNPVKFRWTTRVTEWNFTWNLSDHCGCGIGDSLYSFGGVRDPQPGGTPYARKFDTTRITEERNWVTQADSASSPHRVDSTAVEAGGKAYMIGGVLSGVDLGDCQEFTPDGGLGSWISRANFNTGGRNTRRSMVSFSLANKPYIIGGVSYDYGDYMTEVLMYSPPPTDTWTPTTDLPTPARANGAAFTIPDNL